MIFVISHLLLQKMKICKESFLILLIINLMIPLFKFQDYCNHLFRLFDVEGVGFLAQEEWISTLKENIR